jgi:hypothetical protein
MPVSHGLLKWNVLNIEQFQPQLEPSGLFETIILHDWARRDLLLAIPS